MSKEKEAEEDFTIESLSPIIAELKADAKSLSKDLVGGIEATGELGDLTFIAGILLAFLAGAMAQGQIFQSTTLALLYGGLGVAMIVLGFRDRRKHSSLKKKYSTLLQIWAKLEH